MKILVVEDSAKLLTPLIADLRKFGYAVEAVTDAAEAITHASDRDYDIIILDLMLPIESSLLVLHEIRELDRKVEILILSTQDQIHDRVTALIQGADDYLVHPFSFDDLHSRIQSLVKRRANSDSPGDYPTRSPDTPSHLNRLIGNLLKRCHGGQGEIELVISEIRLEELLNRVCSKIGKDAEQKDLVLRLPRRKLPTLLVDAKWMEHLLVNLISNAIKHSKMGSEIWITFQTSTEYCSLEIKNQMAESLSAEELKAMFREFCNRGDDINNEPMARFSLVKSYADCMHLGLHASITDEKLFQVRVSNIKLV